MTTRPVYAAFSSGMRERGIATPDPAPPAPPIATLDPGRSMNSGTSSDATTGR